MSVSTDRTDDWLAHLPFASPRPSQFGLVDGLFYGLLSVDGDASGGVVTLDGRISQERKTDWVHILGGFNLRTPQSAAIDGYVEFRSGPRMASDGLGIDQPTFSVAGDEMQRATITGDNMTAFPPRTAGGFSDFPGMPLYGDPQIQAVYDMVHCAMDVNTDTVIYTYSMWGFLVRPQTMFRGVAPSTG